MLRTIAKLLVFFILFANLAWAADMDEIGLAQDAAKVMASINGLGSSSDDGGAGHDGLKNGPCDHCCHGTAHYTGFPHETSFVFADSASCTPTLWVTAQYSRDEEPPIPPPNI